MRRREFITLAALGIAAPLRARAQQGRALPLVGLLHPGFPTYPGGGVNTSLAGLEDGLRERGYVGGETVNIEARWGLGKPEALAGFARELVQLKVDVLVAIARPSIEAARAATKEVPIVAFDLESDPIESGFVASWAIPGGNITGLFLDLPGLAGKWLQLMREVVPEARRAAVLWDATTGDSQLRALSTVAKAKSLDVQVLEFHNATTMESVLSAGLKEHPQALIQLGSPLINAAGARIAEIVASYRVPAISQFRSFADGGGMMSYGPVLPQWLRRLGNTVASILKGAKSATLPLEQPTNFELIVNLRAATAMGIPIPQALLLRADEVIE